MHLCVGNTRSMSSYFNKFQTYRLCSVIKMSLYSKTENKRFEHDSIGEVLIEPHDSLYGVQTVRSKKNFCFSEISSTTMPREIIDSILIIKKAAAKVNFDCGKLAEDLSAAIIGSIDKIRNDISEEPCRFKQLFPLAIWQTGSGTQTNMNVNEVVANFGNRESFQKDYGTYQPLHPNDHINMSQSSNDVFPSSINIAVLQLCEPFLLDTFKNFLESLHNKSRKFKDIIKIGRTHCQDAVPMTLGNEFLAFYQIMKESYDRILLSLRDLQSIPIGGTAIGTGLNSPKGFDEKICSTINDFIDLKMLKLSPAVNKYAEISSKSRLSAFHSTLAVFATEIIKFTNDIKILSSGPLCGFNELNLPANEPGSSIMPGKVNPTQCEMLAMIAAQIIGNNQAIQLANLGSQFQLNTYMPMLAYNVILSIHLLKDGLRNFTNNCLCGIQVNEAQTERNVQKSPMLITCLNKHLGYENCARIVKLSLKSNMSLKEAGKKLDLISEEDFDRLVRPREMALPSE
ncbi:MAG: hypothetical protein MHMPM18_001752 [Marteilia pararefringens]